MGSFLMAASREDPMRRKLVTPCFHRPSALPFSARLFKCESVNLQRALASISTVEMQLLSRPPLKDEGVTGLDDKGR